MNLHQLTMILKRPLTKFVVKTLDLRKLHLEEFGKAENLAFDESVFKKVVFSEVIKFP